jgi:hypothetical protein
MHSPGITLAADPRCTQCRGTGRRKVVCGCCFRRAFRQCLDNYKAAAIRLACCGEVPVLELVGSGVSAGIKRAEYVADWERIAATSLARGQQKLLRLHFIEERRWQDCLVPLDLDKGEFWHEAYRVQERMGKALAEAGLWPVGSYFGGRYVEVGLSRTHRGAPEVPQFSRPPLRAAA